MLIYRSREAFTGDHLALSLRLPEQLAAFRFYCWYSWDEQTRSMQALSLETFCAVMPGHGRRMVLGSAAEMRAEVERCVKWMKEVA